MAALPAAPAAAADSIAVDAKPIRQFRSGSDTSRFGALAFVGGFEFRSGDWRLHGLSAIRLQNGGRAFLAVTDSGSWILGAIDRDASASPIGLSDVEIAPLTGLDGAPMSGKIAADAESLALSGDRAIVGFERRHRIFSYPLPEPMTARPRNVPLPVPRKELRSNRGLEALAASPPDSPLAGAVIAVAERSIDPAGNLFAGIFGGRENGVFKVRRDAEWDVSDATFLPSGDLLLLERRYQGWLSGLGIRIRRIAGGTIRPDALVDGPVIFSADLSDEIDNMEGIDAWTDAAGETRLTLVSDDNGSIFQRNLILEFRLVEDGLEAAPSN
ncbi:esterase-like activity of phytase family protein [Aurantimonas sp. VKM B-3413]|uniref:esterase-like activity of phytase family protein n=1 Tax=Aurantimonas sp. VKM B-3413 TaxID=2779401 RepID=UPI001E3A7826|nr:esterase-like activity of phytase family protein [Aurantimonas sp. VKM B-3413]MCB8837362.1 esterase-like activity of phytase family protein [Aurantimonas sp. VKM B-3413]